MMGATRKREEVVATIRSVGVIPVIRASSPAVAARVVEAVADAGMAIVEITMTVPNAIDAIADAAQKYGDRILIAAGTVTDSATAERAVDAGASIIVSPCLVPDVIETARAKHVVVIPGALTPTEVFTAMSAGADLVKVFPAHSVGGPAYLRALRGPFPDLPLIPTGGVSLETIAEFFAAGAAAVGVGSELVTRPMLQREDYAGIEALARQFMRAVATAREARA